MTKAYVPPKLQSVKPVLRANDQAASLRIPTPSELGLGTTAEPIDWLAVEQRIDALGASGYEMRKADDGYRFTIEVAGRNVVGRGVNKSDAVRSAFAQLAN